jgi:hypothetical protein
MRFILGLLLTTVLSCPSFAEAARFRYSAIQRDHGSFIGVIVNAKGKRIRGASVTITGVGSPREVKPNRDGYFELELPPGTYKITVKKLGFVTYSLINIEIKSGTFSHLFHLEPACPSHAPPADKTKICPVHHVPLKRQRLGIGYGLVTDNCGDMDRLWAAVKYFPYANRVIYGGCDIETNSPRYEEVLYCPKCREVEKTWPCLETHDTPIITTLPPRKVPRH